MAQLRKSFHERLADLKQEVVRLGSLAGDSVDVCLKLLATGDVSLARQVQEYEDEIDRLNMEIECAALELLATQQPMARDLRLIAAVLKAIGDIERVGDYAVDTAKQAVLLSARPLFKPLVDIPRMAQLLQGMLHDTLEAFAREDPARGLAAVERDHEVDAIYRMLHEELAGYIARDPSLADQAIRLLMISTYLERMADHVTNIGERIHYMVTGELKELHE